MAIIPLASQTQVTAQVPRVALAQPTGRGPDPVVAAVNEGLQGTSKLLDNLAQQEREQLDALFRTNIAAELSEFEVQERAKLFELEAQGTGDESFTAVALRNFEERAAQVGTKYSDQFRNEIKAKLLPLKEGIAVAAMGAEQRKYNAQILANADSVMNVLTNKVRFGASSEEVALAESEQFLQSVPDNLRLGVQLKMREAVRTASMGRAMEADPAGFMQRVQAGEFNDVDATQVERMYEGAANTLIRQQEAAERRREKILDLAQKDPLVAARESLLMKGIDAPSRDQLFAEQQALGVPSWGKAVIDRQTATMHLGAIRNAATPDEAAAYLLNLKQVADVESPEDWDALQRNMQDFAKAEGLPHLATVLEMLNPKTAANYDPALRAAAFELMRNPDAAKAEAKLMDEADVKRVKSQALVALEPYASMRRRSGAFSDEVERDISFLADAALIAKRQADRSGSNFDVAKAVVPPQDVYTQRIDNRNAYIIPTELTKTLSASNLDALRQRIIFEQRPAVPATIPSAERARVDLLRDSGWYNGPSPNTLVLKVRGAEVFGKDGKPIVVPLSTLVLQQAERQVFDRTTVGGTTVLGTPAPELVEQPAARPQPQAQNSTLRPPSARGERDESLFPTGATPGSIELLPPPNYE